MQIKKSVAKEHSCFTPFETENPKNNNKTRILLLIYIGLYVWVCAKAVICRLRTGIPRLGPKSDCGDFYMPSNS